VILTNLQLRDGKISWRGDEKLYDLEPLITFELII